VREKNKTKAKSVFNVHACVEGILQTFFLLLFSFIL